MNCASLENYNVKLLASNGTELLARSTSDQSATFTNLPAVTEFTIRVTSTNNKGFSNTVSVNQLTGHLSKYSSV